MGVEGGLHGIFFFVTARSVSVSFHGASKMFVEILKKSRSKNMASPVIRTGSACSAGIAAAAAVAAGWPVVLVREID
jgi:hypothetical protein